MLHEHLEHYLAEVEQTLDALPDAYVERYEEEIITPERANLRIRIRFAAGHLLELSEAVIIEGETLSHLDYRYHCQDAQNRLLFRYDSTPHFPGLPNFPHHKHVADNVLGVEKPEIIEVIREAAVASPQRTGLKNIGKVSEKLPPSEFELPDMPGVYQGAPLSLADMDAAVLAEAEKHQ